MVRDDPITLFLCGDVMPGRGIDQILPDPSPPAIFEPYVRDARDYVTLAEKENGPIPQPVELDYVWGDALEVFGRMGPDVRVINLETAVTRSEEHWPGKGIHYRLSPANAQLLRAGGIDCCVLANNHVLDWGYAGLAETLATLQGLGVGPCGAGRDERQAQAPAVLAAPGGGRIVVLAFGHPSSGIPPAWMARADRPGVHLIRSLSRAAVDAVASLVAAVRRAGDVIVVSVHWGGNWGYAIPAEQIRFAHGLIDVAGVDIVHGHSSHHVKGIEVYRGRPILYGCGDFINDYEGISGYESFRGDLALMYFPRVDPATGVLVALEMVPTRMRRFRVTRASAKDARWLRDLLDREGRALGTSAELDAEGVLHLKWAAS
jgi:poly-gamma-glutamate synthesis protein (capsule biosynthesis protein)